MRLLKLLEISRTILCFIISVLLTSSYGYTQVDLNRGLIAYYPFNGNSDDVSGKGNHGSLQNGVQLTTDRFGVPNSAYLFDGIDDYIRIPYSSELNPTNAMSIALYFNPYQNTVQTLIGKISYAQGIGTQFQLAMGFNQFPGVLYGLNPPGIGCAGQISLNSSYVSTGASTPVLNQWHCVVATFENGVQKIYLDGVLKQTGNAGFNSLNQCSNSDIQIGSWWTLDKQQFKGKIDDIRLYNKALSQDEVNALCLQITPAVQPMFTTPDTVCVNTPVSIINTSTGASSYYWNFCVADMANTTPQGVNLGNPNNLLSMPVFMDYVKVGENYYGFLTDLYPNRLVRLDFGKSLLNTPTAVDLGNFNGIIPINVEGIQMVFNEERWYAIIVGGSQLDRTGPRVLKVDFGGDITNLTPVATNWGNIGGLTYPTDLHVFKEGSNWYGFTVNSENNTITRFDFSSSFNNVPTAVNLGNLGELSYPTGIYVVNDNGYWRGFVTNAGTNSRTSGTYSLTRLDFGSSLLNTPVGVNMGNPGNMLQHPRDLTIMKMCNQIVGFAVNGHANNSNTIKINFNNDLSVTPTMSSLGNLGNSSFPHSISKLFRVNDEVYGFVTNVDNNTITRLRFSGCTNANMPNSQAKDPAPVLYNTPGTYSINLTVDDGLPTQAAFCKQVVVLPEPQKSPTKQVLICPGESVKIGSPVTGATYTWSTGALSDSILITTPGNYWVESKRFGCLVRDSFVASYKTINDINILNSDTTIFSGDRVQLNSSSISGIYSWSPATSLSCSDCSDPIASPQATTTYVLTDGNGSCANKDQITITVVDRVQSCSNWLKLTSQPSYVRVGDLDISGNKLTVEATFNRTAPWTGVDLYQGDLVSKHEDPRDCNYLLRPGSAEITTDRGYFKTPTICNIELNKTYHAAMVYDGTTLKFYRNGYLMSQIAASGNLILNDWQTQIGLYFGGVTQEQFIGYINEVKIWNIARTQAEIVSGMNKPIAAPQSTTGLLAYYTFDNLLNRQGNAAWNGRLASSASINQTNPNCTFVADSCSTNICTNLIKPEFSSAQDVCSPLQVNFNTSLKNVKSYLWTFGNGQTANTSGALATYPSYTTYPVKLVVQYENGCKDSVSKSVAVSMSHHPTLIDQSDTTICLGDSVLLSSTSPAAAYCWKDGISGSSMRKSSIKVIPAVSTTYTLNAQSLGTNLIVNGDFSSGSTGFSSDYTYSSTGYNAGVYYVGSDIKAWHSGMTPCSDHTSGGGNMLLVNGAEQQNVKVWSQTVAVMPNTNYAFTAWLQTITTTNLAEIQFSINGQLLDNIITANMTSCVWNQFSTAWNSGANTTATISIVNMNTGYSGNDFALDDLFFAPVLMRTDTLKVTVRQRPEINLGPDATICKDSTLQLNTNSAADALVKWSPALYLSDPDSQRPTTRPLQTITYVAEAATANGCSSKDTLTVSVLDKPVITLIPNATICQGESVMLSTQSTAATTFSWSPAIALSDPGAASPIASPVTPTTYFLTAGNAGCYTTGSVQVHVQPSPRITMISDTTVCANTAVQLYASGGTEYHWYPAAGLSSVSVAAPVATIAAGTRYTVRVKGANGCSATDSVQLSVFPKPSFKLTPLNPSLCQGDTMELRASGGDEYQWNADVLLSAPDADIALVNPTTTMQYKVVIRSNTCNVEDSLFTVVQVSPKPVASVKKSNDIDCSNFQAQLTASGGSHYEWFPIQGLSDPKVANPVATPSQTTTYQVKVANQQGCYSVDSITVKYDATGANRLFIASAFTPNHDGKNDCFGVRHWGSVKDFRLTIYNRWGEKVFTSNNPSDCWDGRYKGVDQPSGVFVYLIKGASICGEINKKGMVTLVR